MSHQPSAMTWPSRQRVPCSRNQMPIPRDAIVAHHGSLLRTTRMLEKAMSHQPTATGGEMLWAGSGNQTSIAGRSNTRRCLAIHLMAGSEHQQLVGNKAIVELRSRRRGAVEIGNMDHHRSAEVKRHVCFAYRRSADSDTFSSCQPTSLDAKTDEPIRATAALRSRSLSLANRTILQYKTPPSQAAARSTRSPSFKAVFATVLSLGLMGSPSPEQTTQQHRPHASGRIELQPFVRFRRIRRASHLQVQLPTPVAPPGSILRLPQPLSKLSVDRPAPLLSAAALRVSYRRTAERLRWPLQHAAERSRRRSKPDESPAPRSSRTSAGISPATRCWVDS